MILNVFNGIVNRFDFLDRFVGNLDLEFILNAHNKIYQVKTVSAEIIDDIAVEGNVVLVNFKLFGKEFLQPFKY